MKCPEWLDIKLTVRFNVVLGTLIALVCLFMAIYTGKPQDWYGFCGIGCMTALGRAAMDLGMQYFSPEDSIPDPSCLKSPGDQ